MTKLGGGLISGLADGISSQWDKLINDIEVSAQKVIDAVNIC